MDAVDPCQPLGHDTAGEVNTMATQIDDIRRAIRPLRLVFWGGLICIFDLTFS